MHSPYFVRSLLLTGVAGPLVFGIAVFTSGALRSNYSHVDQFISELGETGGEFAWLMNYFGFMLSAGIEYQIIDQGRAINSDLGAELPCGGLGPARIVI